MRTTRSMPLVKHSSRLIPLFTVVSVSPFSLSLSLSLYLFLSLSFAAIYLWTSMHASLSRWKKRVHALDTRCIVQTYVANQDGDTSMNHSTATTTGRGRHSGEIYAATRTTGWSAALGSSSIDTRERSIDRSIERERERERERWNGNDRE